MIPTKLSIVTKKSIMDKMNDKIAFRNWAGSMCKVQISKLLFGNQCSYENLCNLFVGYDTFVVQAVQASGGEGTFILTSQNCLTVTLKLSQSEKYMVSGYEKSNIPLNIHAIIYKDDILILRCGLYCCSKYCFKTFANIQGLYVKNMQAASV